MPTEEEKLQKFVVELEDLLSDFRSNKIVDEQSKRHQKTLEKLLSQTKKVLDRETTEEELKQFREMTKYTQQSFNELKKNTRGNEEFQKEFKKTFGDDMGAGSVNNRLMKRLASSLQDMAQSVNVLSGNLKEDVSDTSLNFLTGPFGKIFRESVDTSGIKNVIGKKFGKTQGQFDAGVTSVPRRGSYILDEHERVVSPDQNKDLTKFLDQAVNYRSEQQEKERAIKIFNESMEKADRQYSQRMDQEESLHADMVSVIKTNHNEVIKHMTRLRTAMFMAQADEAQTIFEKIDVAFDRFMRHPIWNSLMLAMKPLTATMRGLGRVLFGKKESDTDRIVNAVDRIYEFLRTGQVESKQTGFRRLLHSINNSLGRDKLQDLENRASRGEDLSFLQRRRLMKAQSFVTQRGRQGGIIGTGGSSMAGTRYPDMASLRQNTLRTSIVAGDEMREQDETEEATQDMGENINIMTQLMQWIKDFLQDGKGLAGGQKKKTSFLSRLTGFGKGLGIGALITAGLFNTLNLAKWVGGIMTALGARIAAGFGALSFTSLLWKAFTRFSIPALIGSAIYLAVKKLLGLVDFEDNPLPNKNYGAPRVSPEERQRLNEMGRGNHPMNYRNPHPDTFSSQTPQPRAVPPQPIDISPSGPSPTTEKTQKETNSLINQMSQKMEKQLNELIDVYKNVTAGKPDIGPHSDIRSTPDDPHTQDMVRGN